MANIQIRISDEEKAEIQAVLGSMGLSMSGAIKLFLKKIVAEERIPFDIVSSPATMPKAIPSPVQETKSVPAPEIQKTPRFANFASRKIEE